jgi:hypothetical protein
MARLLDRGGDRHLPARRPRRGRRFAERLRFAEDYDLYLRLAQRLPIVDHYTEVSEYRQHAGTLSRNLERMLTHTLLVLRLIALAHRHPPCTTLHIASARRRSGITSGSSMPSAPIFTRAAGVTPRAGRSSLRAISRSTDGMPPDA